MPSALAAEGATNTADAVSAYWVPGLGFLCGEQGRHHRQAEPDLRPLTNNGRGHLFPATLQGDLMAYVEFNAISKHFGTSVAVEDLDLKIEQGEFFSLLGPSGCGKSTTLRMLAGFVKPTTGHIQVNGRDVTALPPEARDIGIVFQNYAIFPHMTVFDNIAFGLVERKLPRAEIKQKVDAALAEVGMTGFRGQV